MKHNRSICNVCLNLLLMAAGSCQAWTTAGFGYYRPSTFRCAAASVQRDSPIRSSLFGGQLLRIPGDAPLYKVEKSESNNNAWEVSPTAKVGGLEGALETGPAFVIRNAVPRDVCNQAVVVCQHMLKSEGSSLLGVQSPECDILGELISRYVDLADLSPQNEMEDTRLFYTGLTDQWTVCRRESLSHPHMFDEDSSLWSKVGQSSKPSSESRLTGILCLNDDFAGGASRFHRSGSMESNEIDDILAVVRPSVGSIIVFPNEIYGQDSDSDPCPRHEMAPISSGTQYILKFNVAITIEREKLPLDDVFFQHDHVVRDAFLPNSPTLSKSFLSHVSSLYNPHMGVENLGEFLYSFVRFTKVRNVVEIGAGFTSLWILQALKDNDDEFDRLREVQQAGELRLLDTNFCVENVMEETSLRSASLLCIDNCLHEKETATGALAVAQALGLRDYFQFLQADAFDLDLVPNSIDVLWCDFGVGSRMTEFVSGAWTCIRPGGFLVCHSTLTNTRTREWLELVRSQQSSGEDTGCGIPVGEYVELSLLEPHKRYQNSVTILQKRRDFAEPIYSEFA